MRHQRVIPRARPRAAVVLLVLLITLGAAALAVAGWREARSDPITRRATIALEDWPAGARPATVALISDLHFCSRTMPEPRLARIRERLARLRPDVILVAGDFVARARPEGVRCAAEAIPRFFAGLRPPLGIVAVLGNHDNWSDPAAVASALRDSGVTVGENSAVRRGPLLIGLVGDTVSGHARLGGTLNALNRLKREQPGATIYLAHSPDIARWLPQRPAVLLAGHTHCGQIVLPLMGPFVDVSETHGNRLRCGNVRYGLGRIIVTAGLGTSIVPLRIGAPPDIWHVSFGPKRLQEGQD